MIEASAEYRAMAHDRYFLDIHYRVDLCNRDNIVRLTNILEFQDLLIV